MNEPVTRQRPSIDLEEFEKAVRDSAQPQRPLDADPLAELARLVGAHHDPYGEVFAQQDAPQSARQSQGQGDAGLRRPSIDFAAIEAGLRGSLPMHEERYAAAQQAYAPQGGYSAAGQDQGYEQGYADAGVHGTEAANAAGWYDPVLAAGPAQRTVRSRRPIYAMAAVIAVGVVGIGVAFAFKGANNGPREVAMIKAAAGPTKIQPPADDTSDQPTRDASILDKAQQPAPTKLVSSEEQPVDLSQAVQAAPASPREVGNGITTLYPNLGGSDGDAASVPVPAPPSQPKQADQTDQKPVDAIGIAADIQPIRVKTRSYRPDGTPIQDDQPPAAAIDSAASAAPAPDQAPPPPAKTATPRATTPKSTTRITAAHNGAAGKPATKPLVVAERDDSAPTDLTPGAAALPAHKVKPLKAPKPVKTADAVDTTGEASQASAGGGGFAVQLAAPGSEAEAKQASSRLSQKYADALSGHRLGFHKASSNGKFVYRVRVGSLTREEATGMCEKLKSSGGSCFVAKN